MKERYVYAIGFLNAIKLDNSHNSMLLEAINLN